LPSRSPISTTSVFSSTNEQDPPARVPRKDVDDPEFPVDRERHFGLDDPAFKCGEQSNDGLVHRGVSCIDQPRQVGAFPTDVGLESGAERRRDAPHLAQCDRGCLPVFDPPHDRGRYARTLGKIDLSPATLDADRLERSTDPLIIHPDQLGEGHSPAAYRARPTTPA
jgi:hypothetical protein